MAVASQLSHDVLRNPCLPYKTFSSPISTGPHYIAGRDFMASIKGILERREGFNTSIESGGATAFSGEIRRVFAWRRWQDSASGVTAGNFIVMLNEVGAGGSYSKVYKLNLATDTAFSLIYTGASSEEFDFVESNNHVFFGNGNAADMQKYNGTTVTNWGITRPSAVPTFVLGGTGIDAAAGYYYRTTFYNQNTGHESSPSDLSACTGVFTNNTSTVTLAATTTDTQVTHWRLYRTTDAGSTDSEDMRLVATTAIGTTTYADATADTSLSDTFAPGLDRLDRPPGLKGFITHAGRIFGFTQNRVYWSGFEENASGVPEESWWTTIDGNFRPYASEVSGIAQMSDGVAVFQAQRIFKIEGDSLDTFRYYRLADRQGARNNQCICSFGGIIFWLDTADQIWMLGGTEVGMDIRTDLKGINHDDCTLLVHVEQEHRWLLLHTGELLYVFDLDTRQWMVPWSVTGTTLYSGETSSGQYDLLLGASTKKCLKQSAGVYKDDGNPYAPYAKTNLFEINPKGNPDWRGRFINAHFETDSNEPATVKILTDDDPLVGSYQDLSSTDLTQRTQGVGIVDKAWQPDSNNVRDARRVSIRFDWDAADEAINLYTLSLGFKGAGI